MSAPSVRSISKTSALPDAAPVFLGNGTHKPVRRLGEKIGAVGAGGKRGRDDDARLFPRQLLLDARDSRIRRSAGGHRTRNASEGTSQTRLCLDRSSAGRHGQRQIQFNRDADVLADAILDRQFQLHRLGGIFRDKLDGKHHIALVADGIAVAVHEARWRRKQHTRAGEIDGLRPVDPRRHAGGAWIAPIGLPAVGDLDFEASHQAWRGAGPVGAATNEAHSRVLGTCPPVASAGSAAATADGSTQSCTIKMKAAKRLGICIRFRLWPAVFAHRPM